MIYWYIGQSGSGKSTLSALHRGELNFMHVYPIYLDGDELRSIFAKSYSAETFTKEYRIEQTLALQRFAMMMSAQGHTVIIATVNPYKEARDEILKHKSDIKYIYVHTDKPRVRVEYWVKDYDVPTPDFLGRVIDINTTGKTILESFNELWNQLRYIKL